MAQARFENYSGVQTTGLGAVNPFLSGSTKTPYIPGLVGGAESFGLTSLTSGDASFASLLRGAPTGALAALIRMDQGPTGLAQSWDSFDMLCLVNLSGQTLDAPSLGVGAKGYVMNLLTGGWGIDPSFGGNGQYNWLASLAPGQVYALLIPSGATNFNMTATGCDLTWQQDLANGSAMYLTATPEPASLMLLALGGLFATRRKR